MVDTTLLDKLNLIYKFVKDNSFTFLIVLLIIIILLDFIYGNNTKQTKILYICIMILTLVYGLFEYYKPFLNILDIYITYIFKLTYFPSIIDYFSMIIITIIVEIYSIKKLNSVQKNINIWISMSNKRLVFF